jgi:hypothetical protein
MIQNQSFEKIRRKTSEVSKEHLRIFADLNSTAFRFNRIC